MSRPVVLFLVALSTLVGSISAHPATAQTGRSYPDDCYKKVGYVEPTEEQLRNFTLDPKNPTAGRYFQGDIFGEIPPGFYDRNGRIGDEFKWPENTVVYTIGKEFTAVETRLILEAQQQIIMATNGCISFRPKTIMDPFYACFERDPSVICGSNVGFQRKREGQVINLRPNCFNDPDDEEGTWALAAHEMIHTLGFFHEQNRPDRDEYVDVYWKNIEDKLDNNFCIYDSDTYD